MKNIKDMKLNEMRQERNTLMNNRIYNEGPSNIRRENELNDEIQKRLREQRQKECGWNFK